MLPFFSDREYTLIRYDQTGIVVMQKASRKCYEVFQAVSDPTNPEMLQQDLQNKTNADISQSVPHLKEPIAFGSSLLYEQPVSTLEKELARKCKLKGNSRFSEQELTNTFEPIIECLAAIYRNGFTHGALSASIIQIDAKGGISLRDWRCFNTNRERDLQLLDFRSLGMIMACCATLQPVPKHPFSQSEQARIFEDVCENYSKSFFSCMEAFINGRRELFQSGLQILGGSLNLDLLDQIYNETKESQTSKTLVAMKQIVVTEQLSCSGSPTKKISLTPLTKKLFRAEEMENKKTVLEDVKKKQAQKISKIIERSNAFVNDLLARKTTHELTRRSAKPNPCNVSLYNVENSVKRSSKDVPIIVSPTKRLRTVSKKK